MIDGLIIDSFAGGGGASLGMEWALGRSPDIAINHDAEALAMHAANHPDAVHLTENIWKVDPLSVTRGKKVGVLWASPDCRHHSKAKGGVPVSKSVRGLADVVLVWAETVKPQIIFLENVEEFRQWGPLGEDGKPCPFHKGKEFARWVRGLETLGYTVEWSEIRACDHGAPTIRKRLFVVARRDSKPILWPAASHNKKGTGGLMPWRTAAEIIDWSLPCPSIFLTKAEAKAGGLNVIRPLADKTMARVARGFGRHVLAKANPFIVVCNHSGPEFRGQGLGDPLSTVTAARDAIGVVTPFVSHAQQGGRSRPADEPLHTVCASTKDQNQIVAPFLAVSRFDNLGQPIDAPVPTITANSFIKRPGAGGPLAAVTGFLVPRYGERPGQEPRSHSIEEPVPVVVPTGNGGGLAACYLAQHNGGPRAPIGRGADEPTASLTTAGAQVQPVMGYLATLQNNTVRGGADEPVGAILASGNHHAVVTPFLSEMYGRSDARAADEPISTVTIKAPQAVVAPFVTSYYSEGGQDSAADAPMPTVPTKARFAPIAGEAALPPLTEEMAARARMVAEFLRAHGVWTGGEFVTIGPYVVWDIGMRMLTPRELARAQGFPDSYILAAPRPGGGVLTETAQRHKVGNSVSPWPAAALVYANCVTALAMPDVKRRKRAKVPTWPGFPIEAPRQASFLEAA